jgi:hypothetical protein
MAKGKGQWGRAKRERAKEKEERGMGAVEERFAKGENGKDRKGERGNEEKHKGRKAKG